MDPNETLKTLRRLVKEALNNDNDPACENNEEAYQLAEAFDNLDTWLTKGGLKPTDWHHNPDYVR